MANERREWGSLVELLRWRAEHEGDRPAKSFLAGPGKPLLNRSYAELDRAARAIAVELSKVTVPGDRAVLLYPPGLDFTEAFFGCLYAGVAAVPAPPPEPNRLQRTLPRLRSILLDCRPAVVLSVAAAEGPLAEAAAAEPALAACPRWSTDEIDHAQADAWVPRQVDRDSLAYIQYTSGSTAAPKGVLSTHGHLLRNSEYIAQGFAYERESRQLSWVPDYHDDGLVQGVVMSVYVGCWCLRMPPFEVARRPLTWLRAISDHRITNTGGPNFVYELAVTKTKPEECEGLDLSRWVMAYNAAEPVRATTLRRFYEAFAPYGFRWQTFFPAFGMAETTLLIASGKLDQEPVLRELSAEGLERRLLAMPAKPGETVREVVGCGRPVGEARFEIVDPATFKALPEGQLGELWIKDPCVASGYWEKEEATRETFEARLADSGDGPFLRTGDLAFLLEGELYIAGRLKDLIILRGRNLYPQDVEQAAEVAHPLLRRGCTAAFSVEQGGEERLVVVQEVQPTFKADQLEEVASALRRSVAESLDVEVWAVVLIESGTLPKTSSGKIQRRAARVGFVSGELAVVGESRRSAGAAGAAGAAVPVDGAELLAWLRGRLAQEAGCPVAAVDGRQPFSALGLGSAAMVAVAAALEDKLRRPLPATLLYQYPTPERLCLALAATEAAAAESPAANRREPIAIVGIGLRFPGADGPEAFWRLLEGGIDAVSEVPGERWDLERYYAPDTREPGKMTSRWGGFLNAVDGFDPAFFGISRREAERMDPQQRLLLEVAWEALEDAGIGADAIAGSATGVFVGIAASDYGRWLLEDAASCDAYSGTGGAYAIAANRISYCFDLRGPSVAVDTACSSSLVAVEQACQALRRGECTLALAGGANLLLAPEVTVAFSRGGFLAPDGRCKAFDARADGYVRSEGAGLVVLKPLSRAQADGDPIYALILGGAVNQDGRSNGLTAPNPAAQEAMLRLALADAGVAAAEVSMIEAHGTGTPLGDPIEALALGKVIGQARPAGEPCALGSVKTNLGHLEAAAGIAGLVKAALCLHHRRRVPSLHFERPNPMIDLEGLGLAVTTSSEPWASSGPRRAGVSSFGFGGTNAHVLLGEAPAPPPVQLGGPLVRPGAHPLLLSARSAEALVSRARDLSAWLAKHPDAAVQELAYTMACRRAHLDHRLALGAGDRAELDGLLAAFLAGGDEPRLARGVRPAAGRPAVAFVFPGQGSQWLGMGRELWRTEPVFRAAAEQAAEALRPWVEVDPLADLVGRPDPDAQPAIDVVQPALFLIQVALAALWRSWGVEPVAVVGHSLGEVAAAHVAGVLTLEAAARVIALRSRLMRRASGLGTMLAVELPESALSELLLPWSGRVEVAVVNGPGAVTLSGDPVAIESLRRTLEERGASCRAVKVDVAAHGPQMEPLSIELESLLGGLAPQRARVPMISTVTANAVAGPELGAAYWRDNLRRPVRFRQAVEELVARGIEVFLEVSPHPLLLTAIAATAEAAGRRIEAVGSLRREENEGACLGMALGRLWAAGVDVDWPALFPAGAKVLSLPSYPWQRERFWLERAPQRAAVATDGHVLLGRRIELARSGETVWQRELGGAELAFVDAHRVRGARLMPGTAWAEAALAAAAELGLATAVEELRLHRPLELPDHPQGSAAAEIQTVVGPDAHGRRRIEIYGADGSGGWMLLADGSLGGALPAMAPLALAGRLGGREIDGGTYYAELGQRGYDYGGEHRGLRRLWVDGGEVVAELVAPAGVAAHLDRFLLHPALLDAAWQSLGALLPESGSGRELWVPAACAALAVHRPPGERLWVLGRLRAAGAETLRAEVAIYDESGAAVAATSGLELRKVAWAPAAQALHGLLYEERWRPAPLVVSTTAVAARSWWIVPDAGGVADALARELAARGEQPRVLPAAAAWDAAILRSSLRVAAAAGGPPPGPVVFLAALDQPPSEEVPGRAASLVHGALALVRELALGGAPVPPRLWLAHRAQGLPQAAGGGVASLVGAPLAGFARALAHEHPELFGGLVAVPEAAPPLEVARALLAEAGSENRELEVGWSGGRRWAARLVRAGAGDAGRAAEPVLRSDAAYLVTGGFGGLGLAVSRSLVAWGARHLVLVGRHLPPPGAAAAAALDELMGRGVAVETLALDVADEAALGGALAARRAAGAPAIAGVVHAAGVVRDGALLELAADTLEDVLRPKVAGAWALDRQLAGEPLDFFALFSSAAVVIGNPGQAAYCAANAFLGALAAARRAAGKPASVLHWGVWGEIGAAAGESAALARAILAEQGFGVLTPEQGLAALGRVLAEGSVDRVVLPLDARRLREARSVLASSALWSELLPSAREVVDRQAGAGMSPETWRMVAGEARKALLDDYLDRRVTQVLRLAAGPPDRSAPLPALGLDSLLAVELRAGLERDLGVDVPLAWVLQGATLETLAERLGRKLEASGAADQQADTVEAEPISAEEAARLLGEVEELSEAEVEALLARMAGKVGEGA